MARPAPPPRDTSIKTYRAKRDFNATAEPPPSDGTGAAGRGQAGAPIFVVQKHQARRAGLHWDFRLEHGNVLWSWAVRKGPSLDPTDKRIAAHVEDHPLDYADFQGTIPDGHYGAGTVEMWDRGTWQPLLDPDDGLRDGEIKFVLRGKRLNGKFTLVRLRPKPEQRGRPDNWLLIKGLDEHQRAGGDAAALEAAVAAPGPRAAAASAFPGPPPASGALRRTLPERQAPQLASIANAPAGAGGASARAGVIVTARAPKSLPETIEGVTLTHPDRALWPGVTKRDLAAYWQSVASHALPGLIKRPLTVVRCPDGVAGEHFFQKHAHGWMPAGIHEGSADKAPFLAIDDLAGLVAMAQMSAVELHAWGATEADPLHPDQLVFDLDPGEGVGVAAIAAAAQDLRESLAAIGLAAFCRTSGGKGLHVVVPLRPRQAWDPVRAFCKSFAEGMSEAHPDKYLAHVKIADRRGRILIDWLRNGLGSTAVASFCPRARPGAGVATPLVWKEVTSKLDLTAFTLRTVPGRLAKLRADPWADFERSRRSLPAAPERRVARKPAPRAAGSAVIVTPKPPKPRRPAG